MNMMVEEYEQGQTLFNCGEVGTKFYIILTGSVGVYIPEKVKITEPVRKERKLLLTECRRQF
jgi:CRP-like cAMP-binding protein